MACIIFDVNEVSKNTMANPVMVQHSNSSLKKEL